MIALAATRSAGVFDFEWADDEIALDGDILVVAGYVDQGGSGIIQAALDTGAFDTFNLPLFSERMDRMIDGGDVIVHLFRPEVRTFYNLEKMWSVNLPTEQAAV